MCFHINILYSIDSKDYEKKNYPMPSGKGNSYSVVNIPFLSMYINAFLCI